MTHKFVIEKGKVYKRVLSKRISGQDTFSLVPVKGPLAHEIMRAKGFSFKRQTFIA